MQESQPIKLKIARWMGNLWDNQYLVFFSSIDRNHYYGSGLTALQHGAHTLVKEGVSGSTYALPVFHHPNKVKRYLPDSQIKQSVNTLCDHATNNKDKNYILIGSSFASRNINKFIAHCFSDNINKLENISLPQRYVEIITNLNG